MRDVKYLTGECCLAYWSYRHQAANARELFWYSLEQFPEPRRARDRQTTEEGSLVLEGILLDGSIISVGRVAPRLHLAQERRVLLDLLLEALQRVVGRVPDRTVGHAQVGGNLLDPALLGVFGVLTLYDRLILKEEHGHNRELLPLMEVGIIAEV